MPGQSNLRFLFLNDKNTPTVTKKLLVVGLIFHCFIPKIYQSLWHPSTTLICFQFKNLHNLTDKSVNFKDAYSESRTNNTLSETRETWKT